MQAVWTPIATTGILRSARIPVRVRRRGMDRRAGFRLPTVAERPTKDKRLPAFSGSPPALPVPPVILSKIPFPEIPSIL